ncbi:MAG: group I intron-associated PD-(D/E)XK endonuclease [Halobacteriales archaeon]|nr:group I intron-associated PD-(D/E)XK endonuclease [Halobacteriales archaeon]
MRSNSKDTGDQTEAHVIHQLIASGYRVSIPFGDNDKYDLIADSGETLYRIQCKTAWRSSNETIRFNTHSQTTKDGEYHERSYHGDIDGFIVRYPANEKLYWIDIEDATGQKMNLRFESEIDHPSINWAHEHEFTGKLPE